MKRESLKTTGAIALYIIGIAFAFCVVLWLTGCTVTNSPVQPDTAFDGAIDESKDITRNTLREAAETAEAERLAAEQAEEEARVQAEYLELVESYGTPYIAPPASSHWFKSAGVMDYNGWLVTYYNPARMGTSATALGNYTIGRPITYDSDGIGRVDGYIAVAMPSEYNYGSIVDTPFGTGIVVDHSGGVQDLVVNW